MDDRLNLPAASPRPGRLGARGETLLALLAAVSLAAAAFFGWRAYVYTEEGDPVATAAGTFERRNDLIVLTYRMEVVSESVIKGPAGIGLLERRRLAIIPARIDYRIELSKITKSRMQWDAAAQTLRVTLPPLRISKPNLDEARARVFVDGVWVSRGDAESLARKNSEIAERKAVEFAKNREILGIARAAAREAVRDNLAAALRAAGHPQAAIQVRFEGEG
ncbi:DUF4230 domain-containing protein [Porphyrobacter sp. AAP82]|uniref:DUF4230 domain-containing protein n=1 Tax=Porphyrobacter sp. AAP82 TaxID=1248917 RepID=UPI000317BDB8|nr:DUF4230 domain-containing protein [Porphyrobacter sp. AAP82]